MSEYIEMDLIKVTDPDQAMGKEVTYWAVTDDTFDNMMNVDYSRMNDKSLQKITMDYLGIIQVERPKG